MSDELEEIRDGDTTWRFEPTFLRSNWTCIWGRGCAGILSVPAPELHQGCCSVGAVLDDEEEARTIAALAATIDDDRFQHHDAEAVVRRADDGTWSTTIVDGACVFLNRPGFAGGAGCALHLEAAAAGESPTEWKPSVCWQLPIHVDWNDAGDTATVRGWTRADWQEDGDRMAWCCTEDRDPSTGADAYVGDGPVVERLAEELVAITGEEVYVELRRRLSPPDSRR
jgi:hypothetical protein